MSNVVVEMLLVKRRECLLTGDNPPEAAVLSESMFDKLRLHPLAGLHMYGFDIFVSYDLVGDKVLFMERGNNAYR